MCCMSIQFEVLSYKESHEIKAKFKAVREKETALNVLYSLAILDGKHISKWYLSFYKFTFNKAKYALIIKF